MLSQTAIFLAAAVLMVPIARKLGLGAVLGYLAAGVLIGPWGLRLIDDVEAILHFAEFGVVLFLFVIGLELQPSRLWVLRRQVFGLGSAQVLASMAAIACIALFGFGLGWRAALIVGLALAMSSTALVLQSLAEKQQLTARHGRDAFAILLFQDLAVIPILALMPMMAGGSDVDFEVLALFKAVAIIAAVIFGGRHLLRPAFKWIATLGSRETFTAAALLVVIGTTLLMEVAGLTASLGAFLAGVLLADSEYRHELEADIEPFKGLLLGLFFIAVGMSANLGLLRTEALPILSMVLLLMAVKFAVLYWLGRVTDCSNKSSRKLAVALAQGGEFAFVLFQLARQHDVLSRTQTDWLIVLVTLSMLAAPLLFVIEDKFLAPKFDDKGAQRPFDKVEETSQAVLIAGFGRVGQIVARLLALKKITFTVLDASATHVDYVRQFGSKAYYGDASRLDVLHAAGIEHAKIFVLAIDDVEASIKTAELVRRHYPNLPIYARARNRFHAYKLMDLGVKMLVRETWHGSLALAGQVLQGMKLPKGEVDAAIARFVEFDESNLKRQHAVYQDEEALVQTVKQAADELRSLFEADAAEAAREANREAA
ncbi:monovalent cation:proton antiporter-2 (CPA2) family protein [Uliginosibacterium sp. H3]|uniref:Monovalent cation:proton antiporter-2 (CPA2) family protein n=1 Tax=Uliginosibacterium silvisoli TaxID=3114758 RepID=A0ABU6JZE5_9RHOO|nr:monovalent cation:proton antiporter-2 (CPA2) family protein [Uliginosibacterium sp. H3]